MTSQTFCCWLLAPFLSTCTKLLLLCDVTLDTDDVTLSLLFLCDVIGILMPSTPSAILRGVLKVGLGGFLELVFFAGVPRALLGALMSV